MFLLLENFVKGRKKYKNPKSEHTGFVPSKEPEKEPEKETHKCTDHEGNIYKSYIEMCKYYEINYKTFLSRKNILKYTIEKCLARENFKKGRRCTKLNTKTKNTDQ